MILGILVLCDAMIDSKTNVGHLGGGGGIPAEIVTRHSEC